MTTNPPLLPQEIQISACTKHREMIRERVVARGWGYLISENDAEAEKRFEAAMDPKTPFTRDNFDPAVMAAFAIHHVLLTTPDMVKRLIETMPETKTGEKSEACPMCLLGLDDWIDPAMQDCAEVIDGFKKTDN